MVRHLAERSHGRWSEAEGSVTSKSISERKKRGMAVFAIPPKKLPPLYRDPFISAASATMKTVRSAQTSNATISAGSSTAATARPPDNR